MKKTNEIRAIPDALALIAIAGNTFAIDAIGTYLDIMSQILDEEGYFVLLVKKNNPEAYTNLLDFLKPSRPS